jgi:hypothetical protein
MFETKSAFVAREEKNLRREYIAYVERNKNTPEGCLSIEDYTDREYKTHERMVAAYREDPGSFN